jgi:hypothetical protein
MQVFVAEFNSVAKFNRVCGTGLQLTWLKAANTAAMLMALPCRHVDVVQRHTAAGTQREAHQQERQ